MNNDMRLKSLLLTETAIPQTMEKQTVVNMIMRSDNDDLLSAICKKYQAMEESDMSQLISGAASKRMRDVLLQDKLRAEYFYDDCYV
jgi:hypothetical protein